MRESKHAFYNTLGTIATLSSQWAIMMLIPRITDFKDAGVFAVALSIVSVLNIVATFYLYAYSVSDGYEKFSKGDYWLCRLFTIGLSFLLCPVAILVFGYSVEQGLVILGYMLYRNLIHYAYLHMVALQLDDHLDYAGKSQIVEGIVSFVTFMGIYVPTHDLVLATFVMAVCGGGVFLALLQWGHSHYIGSGYPHENGGLPTLRLMILIGIPLMASGVIPIVITALPKIVLQMDLGDEITGVFSTLTAPTIIIPTLVTGVFEPFIVRFSDIQRSGNMARLRSQYLKTVGLIAAFGILAIVISIVFAGWAFSILYGDRLDHYVWLFYVMMAGITAYSIGMTSVTVLITKNQGKEAAYVSFAALILGAVSVILLIPVMGIEGATYGLLASYVIFGLLTGLAVLTIPLNRVR